MHPTPTLEAVVLVDGRVRLEPLAASHVDGLMRAGAEASIWAYLPDARYQTRSDFERLVADADRDRRAGLSLPFAIICSDDGVDSVVGTTRYMDIRLPNRGLEIGWTFIDPAYQRTDVNTRCKRLLLGHAFERLGMLRVQLKTDLRNIRSQRAIERLGAHREGVLRQHMICDDGHIRDTVMFSVIAAEWPAIREELGRKLG